MEAQGLPTTYSLAQNYPNPFNPNTTIRFALPEASDVTLDVYTTAGQWVRTVVSDDLPGGYHRVRWDGTDSQGVRVANGLYVYRLKAGDFVANKKMVVIK